jgi:hypothetical protein
MKWSKLKKTVEAKFAESVRPRVNLFTTRYTIASGFMVRGWITVDKVEIANFSTPDNYNKFEWDTPELHQRIPSEERTLGLAMEKGEFSRVDFLDSCWEYINLSIDDAISSENPIINAFAMLDSRLGKRRLKRINRTDLHPLVLRMLDLRLECEHIPLELEAHTNITKIDENTHPLNT